MFCFQASLPSYQADVGPDAMPECCEDREDLLWMPSAVMDGDLIMFLRAARSVYLSFKHSRFLGM